jgi:hypothetical protein
VPGDGDRDQGAALAALVVEAPPEVVQSWLGFPGDRDRRLELSVLAAGEGGAVPGWAALVPCGLDQQSAGVSGSGLVIAPCRRVSLELYSDGTRPR